MPQSCITGPQKRLYPGSVNMRCLVFESPLVQPNCLAPEKPGVDQFRDLFLPLVSALTSPLTPTHFFDSSLLLGMARRARRGLLPCSFLLWFPRSYPAQLHWGVNTGTDPSVCRPTCQEKGGCQLRTRRRRRGGRGGRGEREGGLPRLSEVRSAAVEMHSSRKQFPCPSLSP